MERKATANDLTYFLSGQGVKCQSIHGDRGQAEREKALNDFKRSYIRILIATDVAARGLDIPNVAYVIIFDLPSNIDSYVHRIGRTGRIGNTGMAISLVDERPSAIHKDLLDLLAECKQDVPDWFRKLASGNGDLAADSFSKPGGGYNRGGGRGNNSWNDRGGYNSYNRDEGTNRDDAHGRGYSDSYGGGRGNSYNNYNPEGSARSRGGRGRGNGYGANDSYGGQGTYNNYGGGYAPKEDYAPREEYSRGNAPRGGNAPRRGNASREGYAPRDGYASRDGYAPRDGYQARDAYPPRQEYNNYSKPESQGWGDYEDRPDTGYSAYQNKDYGEQGNGNPRGRYNGRGGNNSRYGNNRGGYSNWNAEEPDYSNSPPYPGSYANDSSAPSNVSAPSRSQGYGVNNAAKYPPAPNPAYPPASSYSYSADKQGYNNPPNWSAFPVVEEPESYYPPAPQNYEAPSRAPISNSNDKPPEDDPWAEA